MSSPAPYRIEWPRLEQAAAALGPASAPTLVSVDWDFFLPPADLGLWPDDEAEMLSAGVEFRLEEWFERERAEREWAERASRIELLGHHPEELFSLSRDPSPADLVTALGARFDFGECLIADSHLWGAVAALRAAASGGEEPARVISFDAHHDLGYLNYAGDEIGRSRVRAEKRPSCDDWIQASFVHELISSAEIVYPDWSEGREWHRSPPTVSEEFIASVSPTRFSWWCDDNRAEERIPATLLVVRSASYSPPFFGDENFLELARNLCRAGSIDWRCLDCDPPALADGAELRIGAQDACRPRPDHRSQKNS